MRFVFIAAEKAKYPVRLLCELLEVSRSGYYAWIDRPAAPKTISDAQLVVEIKAAMVRGRGAYGSPRVHLDLRAHGIHVSKKRIERLMRENDLVARQKRRFVNTTDSNHGHPVAPNVLDRNFDVKAANEVWVGDVTYIPTAQGWLYLAVLLDLFARRVVGWAPSATNDTELALRALDQALRARHPLPGLVQHTDRGSPYASGDYRRVLEAQGRMRDKGLSEDEVVMAAFTENARAVTRASGS